MLLPSRDQKISALKIIQTKKDKHTKAALDLKLFVDRLKDTKIEIDEISDSKSSFTDPDTRCVLLVLHISVQI